MLKKRNRPNAFRSCKGCKEQKKRCELKETALLIEPSNEPLEEKESCQRCHILALPCILNDFEKIEKIAIKRRKNDQLHHQKEQEIRIIENDDNNPPSNLTSTSSSTTITTSFDTFPTDLQEFKRFTPRNRPITLVSELAVRQPTFANQTKELKRIWKLNACLDWNELMNDTLADRVSVWCEDHLLVWLPGLPNPNQIRKARKQNQPLTASIQIVELAQYVVAFQHSNLIQLGGDQSKQKLLIISLTRKIEQFLPQCILGSQRDLYAAQAFELLAVFPIASAFLESSSPTGDGGGKVESLEVNMLASNSYRIACTCKQEYESFKWQKGHMKSRGGDQLTAREFELAIQWCSSSSWEYSHCMASNDVIRFYGNRSNPKQHEIQDFLSFFRSNPSPGLKGLGQLFVLLRSHLVACVLQSWEKLHNETPFALSLVKRKESRTMEERLKILAEILKEHEELCDQSKALRYTWLESHKAPEAQLILAWLDMEDLAYYLMISGRSLFFALHEDENQKAIFHFTPDFLFKMINGEVCQDPIRQFIFHHGDNRNDAGESLLMITSSFSSFCDPKKDFIVPTLLTCGYIMEACMLAMEVHGTSARYWKSLPRSSKSWQVGMKGSKEMLKKMKDVHEEQGGIISTITRLIEGMNDVIGIWTKAITKSIITQNSMQNHVPASTKLDLPTSITNLDHTTTAASAESHQDNQNHVGGIDVGIPPLSTDGEQISLDQLLRDMFGSTDWLDVLPSVEASSKG